jgi:DeoR family transcriptional regulator, aga operon transcriptional repressor
VTDVEQVDEPPVGIASRSSRLSDLLDLLAERGRLAVAEAASALSVSEATVRRDFNELARQQLVTRTHGGVVASSVAYDLPVRYRGRGNDVRERIGAAAAALVQPGDVVGFNGGTTTSATARRLAALQELAEHGVRPGLTVVTNALNIATEMVLRPHIRTVTLGGIARPQSYELVGPLAVTILRELWIDHLFLGVDGLDVDGGASCFHEGEAGINALMVERASRTTVVAAAAKLGRRTFARICDVASVTTVVTDGTADPDQLESLRSQGIEVVLA